MHKDRNIQRHLPKRYRAAALEQNSYKDKKMLQEFERWLRDINECQTHEALEEVLISTS